MFENIAATTEDIIRPETDLETRIISDPNFIGGMMYGKPRKGHPEGFVISHIGHVLDNVDKYCTNNSREALRLIAIIHDSMKYRVDRSRARVGENHHSMIARRFAEKYITDDAILDIIELHDDAFKFWCIGDGGNWDEAEDNCVHLIERLGDNIWLYLDFYRCDNETGDKKSDDYLWFENFVKFTLSPEQGEGAEKIH